MEKLRSNNVEIQKKTSELLNKGIRVFPEPVTSRNYQARVYVICVERKTSSGKWGYKYAFEKQVTNDMIEDAYVRTIEYLYDKEITKKIDF